MCLANNRTKTTAQKKRNKNRYFTVQRYWLFHGNGGYVRNGNLTLWIACRNAVVVAIAVVHFTETLGHKDFDEDEAESERGKKQINRNRSVVRSLFTHAEYPHTYTH